MTEVLFWARLDESKSSWGHRHAWTPDGLLCGRTGSHGKNARPGRGRFKTIFGKRNCSYCLKAVA